MPNIITRGAMSAKALGFTGQTTTPVYVEDVFSTYLYTGNGSAQTITNNIDLSTKGGMVWTKSRSNSEDNNIVDTSRGGDNMLYTNQAIAQFSLSGLGFSPFSFLSNGYSYSNASVTAQNLYTFVSWTFREQPKFFDIVTYTGDGSARTIAHSLGSVPGMIIVKRTDAAGDWWVYHSSLANTQYMRLNTTQSVGSSTAIWNSTTPTSTVFSLGNSNANINGATYVAYLFANQAGGFGLSGTDSVVACGSYTGTGASGNFINLGWEPQFVLAKQASAAGNDWVLVDIMRGFSRTAQEFLYPDASSAAVATSGWIVPTATGFTIEGTGSILNGSGSTYIYLAIRRGPMKVPTSGTSVFSPKTATGTSIYDVTFDNSLIPDLILSAKDRTTGGYYNSYCFNDRLRGLPQDMTGATYANNPGLISTGTNAEATGAAPSSSNYFSGSYNSRVVWGGGWTSYSGVFYGLKRAPGFMDEVCYAGTGSATTVAHNLGVAPEMMIVKGRNSSFNWAVYAAPLGNTKGLELNNLDPPTTSSGYWNNTSPTSSIFTIGGSNSVNSSSTSTYVAYLFATCPGVSKVGSYTGTGAAQNIDCGFSAGARFILIKRTDSTGDWYVYDSARGISSGNDPYLLLNSANSEAVGTNYVDTFASGFKLTASAPAALNANGGSYIFLAIA